MELRHFAEAVLFGTSLADKLIDPGRMTDREPGSARPTPSAPSRPAELAFGAPHKPRATFPSAAALSDPSKRAEMLHFFANHELLALELMALMLLRFPDAPGAWRRGLAQTMRDEQRHLQIYLERMKSLADLEPGAIGVNDFFWRCISPASSPMEFAARMSLTFEQANLDYAGHYAALCRSVGDFETASALDTVLADEIRHVRHGLVWFERLNPGPSPLFDRVNALLAFPLTPARAKGLGFSKEVRLAAGLPADYIETLRAYAHSKGRPPQIFWFNPTCEMEVAQGRRVSPKRAMVELQQDLEPIQFALAGADDVVLTSAEMPRDWRLGLLDAGLEMPQFETLSPAGSAPGLRGRQLGAFRPWGESAGSAAQAQRLGLGATSPPNLKERYSKSAWVPLLKSLVESGVPGWHAGLEDVALVVPSAEEAIGAAHHINDRLRCPAVVKAPLAASGRGNVVVGPGDLDPRTRMWLDRLAQDQGALLVEPWRERVWDVSVQFEIVCAKEEASPRVQVLGWCRFLTDGTGRYRGTLLGRRDAHASAEMQRFVHGNGLEPGRLQRALIEVGMRSGERLAELGHRGLAAADAMVFRGPEGLRFKPLLEVNPRTTMGHVALALERRLPGTQGAFALVHRAEILNAGFEGFSAFTEALRSALPLQRCEITQQIHQAALALAPPQLAKQVLPLVAVSKVAGRALEALQRAGWGGFSANCDQ